MRLFLAVDVPDDRRRSIEKAVQPLRLAVGAAGATSFRWVPRENWHATIKFLGEVPDGRVEELGGLVREGAARVPPTSAALGDVAAFPSLGRARVLWVGLDEPAGRLAPLATRLEQVLGAAGFRQEARPLRLHVTIARLRTPAPVGPLVVGSGPYVLDRDPFPVEALTLYRSHLGRGGATYEPLAAFALAGAPPDGG